MSLINFQYNIKSFKWIYQRDCYLQPIHSFFQYTRPTSIAFDTCTIITWHRPILHVLQFVNDTKFSNIHILLVWYSKFEFHLLYFTVTGISVFDIVDVISGKYLFTIVTFFLMADIHQSIFCILF